MNKFIKIIFNDDVTQEQVDEVADTLILFLNSYDLTAVQIVSEEECEDEQA